MKTSKNACTDTTMRVRAIIERGEETTLTDEAEEVGGDGGG